MRPRACSRGFPSGFGRPVRVVRNASWTTCHPRARPSQAVLARPIQGAARDADVDRWDGMPIAILSLSIILSIQLQRS